MYTRIVSLRAAGLAPRCAACGRPLVDVGGHDRRRRLAWCVRCSLALDYVRGAAA